MAYIVGASDFIGTIESFNEGRTRTGYEWLIFVFSVVLLLQNESYHYSNSNISWSFIDLMTLMIDGIGTFTDEDKDNIKSLVCAFIEFCVEGGIMTNEFVELFLNEIMSATTAMEKLNIKSLISFINRNEDETKLHISIDESIEIVGIKLTFNTRLEYYSRDESMKKAVADRLIGNDSSRSLVVKVDGREIYTCPWFAASSSIRMNGGLFDLSRIVNYCRIAHGAMVSHSFPSSSFFTFDEEGHIVMELHGKPIRIMQANDMYFSDTSMVDPVDESISDVDSIEESISDVDHPVEESISDVDHPVEEPISDVDHPVEEPTTDVDHIDESTTDVDPVEEYTTDVDHIDEPTTDVDHSTEKSISDVDPVDESISDVDHSIEKPNDLYSLREARPENVRGHTFYVRFDEDIESVRDNIRNWMTFTFIFLFVYSGKGFGGEYSRRMTIVDVNDKSIRFKTSLVELYDMVIRKKIYLIPVAYGMVMNFGAIAKEFYNSKTGGRRSISDKIELLDDNTMSVVNGDHYFNFRDGGFGLHFENIRNLKK